MYIYIAMLAYAVVLFLTLRDIRIFKRTRLLSYRKGAIKGLLASTVVLFGALITASNPEFGLLVVFIGIYVNKKGFDREKVFINAGTVDRLLGKTDI